MGAPPPADDNPAAAVTETVAAGPVVDHVVGLDEAAVRARVSRGDVNEVPAAPSRTVPQILRANIFTRFNAILGALLVVIIIVGPFQDALFGVVLVANAAIGIIQELRAKRTLDQLAVLSAPHAAVVRGGEVVGVVGGSAQHARSAETHAAPTTSSRR